MLCDCDERLEALSEDQDDSTECTEVGFELFLGQQVRFGGGRGAGSFAIG